MNSVYLLLDCFFTKQLLFLSFLVRKCRKKLMFPKKMNTFACVISDTTNCGEFNTLYILLT